MITLETERLLLRSWKNEDAEPYYEINQDPKVLEFLIGPLSRETVAQFIADKNRTLCKEKYTLWAVEKKATGAMIGFIGLQEIMPLFPFSGIEIGWRLGSQYWGNGYAAEGARAVLKYGFQTLQLKEIFSYTAAYNQRSRRVMEKIGMTYLPSHDFHHPKLSKEHPLSVHVLYRISNTGSIV